MESKLKEQRIKNITIMELTVRTLKLKVGIIKRFTGRADK